MARILIVEDDAEYGQLLSMGLRKAGHQTALAMDPPTGLVQMRKFNPDVVVLDIRMPAGGGKNFLDAVSEIPNMALVPVIVVTGDDSADTRALAERYNVAKFFLKPVDQTALAEAVKELTGG